MTALQADDKVAVWRNSYDVDDPRAQVSTIYWEPTANNANMWGFKDAYEDTTLAYAKEIRKPGKTLPISLNARQVLQALFAFMDGKTGRCDPTLDRITKRSGLSRRTVVRQLAILRKMKIIDWVRRTVMVDNGPEGKRRRQTSNSYFIPLSELPKKIIRTLRHKLGDKLRETTRKLIGSGPVPSRMQGAIEKLRRSASIGKSAPRGKGRNAHEFLAGGTENDRIVAMYNGDKDMILQHLQIMHSGDKDTALRHLEALDASYHLSPSATLALGPSPRYNYKRTMAALRP